MAMKAKISRNKEQRHVYCSTNAPKQCVDGYKLKVGKEKMASCEDVMGVQIDPEPAASHWRINK